MNKLKKLDRFYLYMLGLVLILSVLVVVTLRAVIGAVTTARELDPKLLEASTPRLKTDILEDAYQFIMDTNPPALDLGQ